MLWDVSCYRSSALSLLDCLLRSSLQEAFDAPGGIHYFSFAGKEWMTVRAELDLERFPCGANLEGLTAGAGYRGLKVLWMDLFFHFFTKQEIISRGSITFKCSV